MKQYTGSAKGKSINRGVLSGELENEELVLPNNRIIVVFIGLVLTSFLAALDQTIVCKYHANQY